MARLKKGFTLVELLVVIMIIGILMGIVIPAIMGGLGGGAEVNCKNNLRSLNQSLYVYMKNNKSNVPAASGSTLTGKKFWMKLCEKGSNVLGITDDDYSASIFQCPVRQTSGSAVKYRGPGAWSTLKQTDPVGCDDAVHPGDVNSGSILRRDGGVDIIQGAEWDTAFGKCVE